MNFLIDECLHPRLCEEAPKKSHYATCVRDRGMLGCKDWDLAKYAVENDFVLVTNNSNDFGDFGGKPGYTTEKELHPGLVCLNALSSPMTPDLQTRLFNTALDYISQYNIQDLINSVLEITLLDNGEVEINQYVSPAR